MQYSQNVDQRCTQGVVPIVVRCALRAHSRNVPATEWFGATTDFDTNSIPIFACGRCFEAASTAVVLHTQSELVWTKQWAICPKANLVRKGNALEECPSLISSSCLPVAGEILRCVQRIAAVLHPCCCHHNIPEAPFCIWPV